ncbi:MAG: hypothetical protein JW760_06210 [Spirochaetales bacterium]|nr:hypothetical protein [Spirochaetales bacterium]
MKDALQLKKEQRIASFVYSGVALSLLQYVPLFDGISAKIIKETSFCVGLKALGGGPARRIIVRNGALVLEEKERTPTDITLLFINPGDMSNLFRGMKPRIIPIIKTFRFKAILSDFRTLMSRLQYFMNPDEETLEQHFSHITGLLIHSALRGVKEVAEQDDYVKARVDNIPDGEIALQVAEDPSLETRMRKKGRFFTILPGPWGENPNAQLIFKTTRAAHDVLKDRQNAMIALGTMELAIRGRISMIQSLFPILDRLGYYMNRKGEG